MPRHAFQPHRGTIEWLSLDSPRLRENLLGDPSRREIAVYLPEGYAGSDADYPLMVALAGFTGSGFKLLGWQSFGETLPQRVDRLVAEGAMGPAIFALPDCFTSLGGNQYVDSLAMGQWAGFLTEEMVPALEAKYRLRRGREHRAVFGKSSGGYGALFHGMRHADTWGAIASHSGDCGFDVIFRRDFPKALGAIAHHGSTERFVQELRDAPKIRGDQFYALMIMAMAASFDPDPTAPFGIRLPVDLETCELDHERWARWLEFDPLHMVTKPECLDNLRRLAGIFIDCGSRDQYFIQYGSRAMVRAMAHAKVDHTYEEFPDNHSGVDYRMDRSLPFLFRALTT